MYSFSDELLPKKQNSCNFVLKNIKIDGEGFMVKKEMGKKEVIEKIAELWQLLDEKQQNYLAAHITVQSFKKHEIIYNEGEQPNKLMCLINGKVKIYKNGVSGRSQILRVIKPVEYFAYRASFANQSFLTAAMAFEPATIALIPMNIIKEFIYENNRLAMFFIQLMAIDLGVADERSVNLTQKHIRGRLAEALLFLKESYGLEEDHCTLSIYLSREDMANLSNMTTSNAIRTLSNFAAEKLIAIDGRKIKIMDEEGLEKISKIG